MAHCRTELLNVNAYCNGFTVWHYAMPTGRTFTDIETDGKGEYFAPVAGVLKRHDIILVQGETAVGVGGTTTCRIYRINEVDEEITFGTPVPAGVLVEFLYAPPPPKGG